MASAAPSFLPCGAHLCNLHSNKLRTSRGHLSQLHMHQIPTHLNSRSNIFVRADYSDGSRGGGGSDFVAGFLLGGAVFGTLGYIFAPQIRRSLMNEDEYGFQRAKRPAYYDEGLEKTRQTLNVKIRQLNSAIDNASSRLRAVIRGGKMNVVIEPVEADSEIETTM